MRIILADDHVMFREGLRPFLERLGSDVEILEAGTLPEVLAILTASGRPDLILLDLKMPGMNGVEGIRNVQAQAAGVPLVILSAVVEHARMVEAIHAGATGYVPKRLSGAAMLSALQLVLSGERFVPYLLQSGDDGEESRPAPPPPDAVLGNLTRREREILTLLKDGLPNKVIALKLEVSEVTVKSHLCSIFRKMGVQNRVQAIRRFVDGVRPESAR